MLHFPLNWNDMKSNSLREILDEIFTLNLFNWKYRDCRAIRVFVIDKNVDNMSVRRSLFKSVWKTSVLLQKHEP